MELGTCAGGASILGVDVCGPPSTMSTPGASEGSPGGVRGTDSRNVSSSTLPGNQMFAFVYSYCSVPEP